MELSLQQKRQIANYKPVTVRGLTLYPIKVKYYSEYIVGRTAIEFMQQTLPPDCISLPLLSAFYKLDFQAGAESKQGAGLFSCAVLFLALALGAEDNAISRLADIVSISVDSKDPSVLKSLFFDFHGDGKRIEVTPIDFGVIRPVLAAQNGIELQSDTANAELVQAERDIAELGSIKLKADIDSLKSGVAALCGEDNEKIDEWAILKLFDRSKAYQRMFDYLICGICEGQGTTWKNGNPAPSLWFEREKGGSAALVPIGNFANGAAEKAVQETFNK